MRTANPTIVAARLEGLISAYNSDSGRQHGQARPLGHVITLMPGNRIHDRVGADQVTDHRWIGPTRAELLEHLTQVRPGRLPWCDRPRGADSACDHTTLRSGADSQSPAAGRHGGVP